MEEGRRRGGEGKGEGRGMGEGRGDLCVYSIQAIGNLGIRYCRYTHVYIFTLTLSLTLTPAFLSPRSSARSD